VRGPNKKLHGFFGEWWFHGESVPDIQSARNRAISSSHALGSAHAPDNIALRASAPEPVQFQSLPARPVIGRAATRDRN
jgi:hypothetical protein